MQAKSWFDLLDAKTRGLYASTVLGPEVSTKNSVLARACSGCLSYRPQVEPMQSTQSRERRKQRQLNV
jgi:hypothetical protein